jgi:branched-chain amino acid transport system permease protein
MLLIAQTLQGLFSGLSTGGIYALTAVGICLIYNATRVVNLAQGEFVVLGGFIMFSLYGRAKFPLIAAFFLTVLIVAAVGAVLKWVVYRTKKEIPVVATLIMLLGCAFFISGMARHIWDMDVHSYPAFSGEDPIRILHASIMPQSLWVIGITIVALVVLGLFFRMSIQGKAMKACAIDPVAASLMGINVSRVVLRSFIFSGVLGGVIGIVITPISMVEYSGGMPIALKGLSAALFGGMGGIGGAILGGLLIGLFESMAATFISSGYKDLVTFIVIINVLIFRPRGLLGKKAPEVLEEEGH